MTGSWSSISRGHAVGRGLDVGAGVARAGAPGVADAVAAATAAGLGDTAAGETAGGGGVEQATIVVTPIVVASRESETRIAGSPDVCAHDVRSARLLRWSPVVLPTADGTRHGVAGRCASPARPLQFGWPQAGAPRGRDSRAGVTQLAECQLPKLNVAGSNPVSRSTSLRSAS